MQGGAEQGEIKASLRFALLLYDFYVFAFKSLILKGLKRRFYLILDHPALVESGI